MSTSAPSSEHCPYISSHPRYSAEHKVIIPAAHAESTDDGSTILTRAIADGINIGLLHLPIKLRTAVAQAAINHDSGWYTASYDPRGSRTVRLTEAGNKAVYQLAESCVDAQVLGQIRRVRGDEAATSALTTVACLATAIYIIDDFREDVERIYLESISADQSWSGGLQLGVEIKLSTEGCPCTAEAANETDAVKWLCAVPGLFEHSREMAEWLYQLSLERAPGARSAELE